MNGAVEETTNQINNESENVTFSIIEQKKGTINILSWMNLVNIIVSFLMATSFGCFLILEISNPKASIDKGACYEFLFLFSFITGLLTRYVINSIIKAYEQEKNQTNDENKNIVFSMIEQKKRTINILSWINLVNIIVSFATIVFFVFVFRSRKKKEAGDFHVFCLFEFAFLFPFITHLLTRYVINSIIKAYEQEKEKKEKKT